MEPLAAYISKQALRANLAAIRQRVGPTSLCAMVKADGYGHGMELVAATLADGVEFFAVARVEEAQRLDRLALGKPILLCEPAPPAPSPGQDSYLSDRLEAICRVRNIRPTIGDAAGAEALGETARRLNVRLPVHLKIDTGMGRNGFPPEEIDSVLEAADRSGSLLVEGIYTHLAAADEPDELFTREQLARFEHLVAHVAAQGRAIRYTHATNSAGLARFDVPHLTLARPGIALYGYQANGGSPWEMPLSPVLRLTARLALLRDLPADHAIGYGSTWKTRRASRIGLLPIGYGDGYNRRFGNLAVMQIRGRDVPVVGRISMDLTTLDLTDLPGGGREVRVGDEVTVISERRSDSNSVEGLARLAGTIPYEITCQIGTRVRRELVDSFAQRA